MWFLHIFPGLSLRSNPGLELANAFGVKHRPMALDHPAKLIYNPTQ
jgi:hypothetical protein